MRCHLGKGRLALHSQVRREGRPDLLCFVGYEAAACSLTRNHLPYRAQPQLLPCSASSVLSLVPELTPSMCVPGPQHSDLQPLDPDQQPPEDIYDPYEPLDPHAPGPYPKAPFRRMRKRTKRWQAAKPEHSMMECLLRPHLGLAWPEFAYALPVSALGDCLCALTLKLCRALPAWLMCSLEDPGHAPCTAAASMSSSTPISSQFSLHDCRARSAGRLRSQTLQRQRPALCSPLVGPSRLRCFPGLASQPASELGLPRL